MARLFSSQSFLPAQQTSVLNSHTTDASFSPFLWPHLPPSLPNMAYQKHFLTSANRTAQMSPVCFVRKQRNSAQMRTMSCGIGILCKPSGFLVHSQFLEVPVDSFPWCHGSRPPGHREHGAEAAQGDPAASGAAAGQVGNAALLPIHTAPPGAMIPDDFNTSTPGFCKEQGPPNLLCQTLSLSDSSNGTKWLHGGCFQDRTHCKAVPALQPCLPWPCSPQLTNHPAISLQPWLNLELRWQCCSTGLVSLDSR